MNFILTISNFIFPLITFPYVSRILGAEGVGTVTFATSIVNYFSMVGMLGIPTYGIRACARVRDDKEKLERTVQEIVVLNTITMSIALLFLAITVLSVDRLATEKVLYLILSMTLIFNVLGVDWLYRSLEQYSYITIRSIVFKLISLIALFLFVRQSEDYVIYGGITVLASVGSNIMNFINLRKIITLKPVSNLNIWQHVRPTVSFFLLSVSATIYLNVDTTMLGFIKGDEVVGYYSAATKLKQILVSVVTSLGGVLLPRLSYYHEKGNHHEFERVVQKALNFVFIVSLPMVVYFTLMAEETVLFLSGEGFLPAILPMRFIMPTVFFIGLSNLMGIQVLVPTNRELLVVTSTVAGALVDILVNSIGIPLFGAVGAAFASSMAELTVMLIQLYFLRELILPMLRRLTYGKYLLSLSLATTGTNFLMSYLSISVFVTLVVSALVFFGIYGITLLLTKERFTSETVKSLIFKRK
ncbi:flippase [Streptococcus hyovaginalis]